MRWKREDVVFDTSWESEVWADSIANEIYGRTIDGYITPDYKIAYALSFFLGSVPHFVVHTEKIAVNNAFIYKVWVT
ncbi:hypothetical protein AB3U99_22830 [Niallia sp. JL1B1071]|uniref:hypothetical protein n=1 Tax=Niallia tiangongensis TaxID=3237105 RepID=UPI0037DC6AB0